MLVNLKNVFLFGLVALSQAEPIRRFERDTVGSSELEIRAKGKSVTDFLCPDKQLLTKNDVGQALRTGRDLETQKRKVGGKYPGFFGNEGGNSGKIFGSTAELREFPIVPNSVYNGGNPGKYRVVFKAGGQKDFVGVMVHGAANSFQACAPPPAAPPPAATTTTKPPVAATPAAAKHTTTKRS